MSLQALLIMLQMMAYAGTGLSGGPSSNHVNEMVHETYVNRLSTSDKQIEAMFQALLAE